MTAELFRRVREHLHTHAITRGPRKGQAPMTSERGEYTPHLIQLSDTMITLWRREGAQTATVLADGDLILHEETPMTDGTMRLVRRLFAAGTPDTTRPCIEPRIERMTVYYERHYTVRIEDKRYVYMPWFMMSTVTGKVHSSLAPFRARRLSHKLARELREGVVKSQFDKIFPLLLAHRRSFQCSSETERECESIGYKTIVTDEQYAYLWPAVVEIFNPWYADPREQFSLDEVARAFAKTLTRIRKLECFQIIPTHTTTLPA